MVPQDAEAQGLLALIELCESRRPARTTAHGELVPLDRQDAALWDKDLVASAAHRLTRAAAQGRLGPFQLEAAIQMAHTSRMHGAPTPWSDIVALYEGLLALHPTIGAAVGCALAMAFASGDAVRGLTLLDGLPASACDSHQPWWAARAHLLVMAGQTAEAWRAYERALGLTHSEAVRHFLLTRQAEIGGIREHSARALARRRPA